MCFTIHPLQGYNVTFHGFDAEEGEKGGEGLGVLPSFKIKKIPWWRKVIFRGDPLG